MGSSLSSWYMSPEDIEHPLTHPQKEQAFSISSPTMSTHGVPSGTNAQPQQLHHYQNIPLHHGQRSLISNTQFPETEHDDTTSTTTSIRGVRTIFAGSINYTTRLLSFLSPRRAVERLAFQHLMGQHQMSILSQKPLPPHVSVQYIGPSSCSSYCLIRPPIHPSQHDDRNSRHMARQNNQQEDIPLRKNPTCIIMGFHGNAESVYGFWDSVFSHISKSLPECMFVAVEYPGYVCKEEDDDDEQQPLPNDRDRTTPTTPSEHSIKSHAVAVFDTLRAQWPDVPIVCAGFSLGSGVALWLSTVRNVSGLLLLAPYLSIMRVGIQWSLPFVDIFDNVLIANKCQCTNVVIVHSEDDPVIPIEHSYELFTRLSRVCSHVKLLQRQNDGHETPYLTSPKFVNTILFNLGLVLS